MKFFPMSVLALQSSGQAANIKGKTSQAYLNLCSGCGIYINVYPAQSLHLFKKKRQMNHQSLADWARLLIEDQDSKSKYR